MLPGNLVIANSCLPQLVAVLVATCRAAQMQHQANVSLNQGYESAQYVLVNWLWDPCKSDCTEFLYRLKLRQH